MKKAIDYLTPRPALFFLLAALLWSSVMFFLNNQQAIQWKDIFVEADGMVFDLLVFGALLAWYDGKRQKNERIAQDKNLIDDFRGWDEKEATYRIMGAIRRLNKEGVRQIALQHCTLSGAHLMGVNLTGANLEETNLSEASLSGAILEGATLIGANLTRTDFAGADLTGAKFSGVDFFFGYSSANLTEASFSSTVLRRADFTGVDLSTANFAGAFSLSAAMLKEAFVTKGWFEKLDQWNIIDKEEIKKNYIIDETGRLQLK